MVVAQRIIFDFAFLSYVDDVDFAKYCKLMRNGRVFHSEQCRYVADTQFTYEQSVYNPESRGVCHNFEEVRHFGQSVCGLHFFCHFVDCFGVYRTKVICHISPCLLAKNYFRQANFIVLILYEQPFI